MIDPHSCDLKKNNLTISVHNSKTDYSKLRFHILIDLFSENNVEGQIKLHFKNIDASTTTNRPTKMKVTWIKWEENNTKFCWEDLRNNGNLTNVSINAKIVMLQDNTYEVSLNGTIVKPECSPSFEDLGNLTAFISVMRLDDKNDELGKFIGVKSQCNPKR